MRNRVEVESKLSSDQLKSMNRELVTGGVNSVTLHQVKYSLFYCVISRRCVWKAKATLISYLKVETDRAFIGMCIIINQIKACEMSYLVP